MLKPALAFNFQLYEITEYVPLLLDPLSFCGSVSDWLASPLISHVVRKKAACVSDVFEVFSPKVRPSFSHASELWRAF